VDCIKEVERRARVDAPGNVCEQPVFLGVTRSDGIGMNRKHRSCLVELNISFRPPTSWP
jgi:hypothetical protein